MCGNKGYTGKLTALSIEALSEPGRHGNGLYLHLAPSGTKSWVQRIVINEKRRDIGLGSYPTVSLAQARSLASDNRSAVSEGRDPLAEKRHAKDVARHPTPSVPTFAEAAARVIELHRPTRSNPKHAAQWSSTLRTYAFPFMGEKAVDEITPSDTLAVLEPIWIAKPETASRVRQRMEAVMDWAVIRGHRPPENPAGKHLLKALPNVKRLKEHHRALPYRDVPATLRKARRRNARPLMRLCFEFLVLTANRSGEVREAQWNEIDWNVCLWTIPAERMKARREHRVPLSGRAVEILRDAWELTGPDGCIFPGPRSGTPISDMGLTQLLRREKIDAVPHGFRSSFRDWAAKQSRAPWAVCEASLAHSIGNSVEQAYMRSDLLEQRRELMQQWADYCVGRL